MADTKPDESKRTDDCPREGSLTACPNMHDRSGFSMDSEWWCCDVCGARITLYYDEMR